MNPGADPLEIHEAVMRAVLENIGREQLVLKGGTALILGYGVRRTTRDLDIDVSRRLKNLRSSRSMLQPAAVPNFWPMISIDSVYSGASHGRCGFEFAEDEDAQPNHHRHVDRRAELRASGCRYGCRSAVVPRHLRAALMRNAVSFKKPVEEQGAPQR
jgi:hypothetical protein